MTLSPSQADFQAALHAMALEANPNTDTAVNRETWLLAIIEDLSTDFVRLGAPLPRVRVSCGFTSSKQAIGECHYPKGSTDGSTEIFIHPGEADPIDVAAILVHELVHAALGPGFGHGPVFGKLARALGLEGKLTATYAGPKTVARLRDAIADVGFAYPHARLMSGEAADKPKKQVSKRLINVRCPDCGFFAKVLGEQMIAGRLVCPVDGEMLLTKDEREGLEEGDWTGEDLEDAD